MKVGDRWWVSGYSAEYHPLLKGVTSDKLVILEMGLKAMAAVAPSLAVRVRSGELKTAEEARSALKSELQQYVMQHGNEFKEYESFVRQHPELFGTPKKP